MSERFIFTRYRTDCYHCKKNADQIIKAVPYQAQVACEDVDAAGTLTKIGKYPVWELVQDATCRNCKVTGPHDIIVSSRHLTVRCRNCTFTHFYKFDLEYIAKDALNV